MTDDRGQRKPARLPLFIILFSVVCCPSLVQAENTNFLANQDSVEVPARSEHVVLDAVYFSPGGHLVLQTDGLDNGGVRVNFYDALTGTWLLPQPVTSMADAVTEGRNLEQAGYSKLLHMPMLTLEDGAKVYNHVDLKNMCFRPYADFIEFAPAGSQPVESAIFMRLKTPETIYSVNDPAHTVHLPLSSHRCRSASGGNPALTVRYQQESPFFFPDNADGFFTLVSRYAVHFDSSGNSAFFKGQENPVLLRGDDVRKFKALMENMDKSRDPQGVIDKAEAIIEQAAAAQKVAQ